MLLRYVKNLKLQLAWQKLVLKFSIYPLSSYLAWTVSGWIQVMTLFCPQPERLEKRNVMVWEKEGLQFHFDIPWQGFKLVFLTSYRKVAEADIPIRAKRKKKIQIRDANEEKNSKDKWYDDKKKSWEIFMVLPKNFLGKKRVSREDFVSFLAFFLTAIGDDYLIFRTTT